MKKSFLATASALLLAAAATSGQTPTARPTFEVATIKPAPRLTMELLTSGKAHIGLRIDKAYADFGGMSLV